MMRCKHTGKIENDLTNRKKISLVKQLLQLEKKIFTIFSRLYFPDFFQVQKIAGQISRLFQEFKTLYEPCLSSFKISLKKYVINSYKSRRFEQFHYHRSLPVLQFITIFVVCIMFAVILVFINLHTDCSYSPGLFWNKLSQLCMCSHYEL